MTAQMLPGRQCSPAKRAAPEQGSPGRAWPPRAPHPPTAQGPGLPLVPPKTFPHSPSVPKCSLQCLQTPFFLFDVLATWHRPLPCELAATCSSWIWQGIAVHGMLQLMYNARQKG